MSITTVMFSEMISGPEVAASFIAARDMPQPAIAPRNPQNLASLIQCTSGDGALAPQAAEEGSANMRVETITTLNIIANLPTFFPKDEPHIFLLDVVGAAGTVTIAWVRPMMESLFIAKLERRD
jgi:hypothetical protein